MVLNRGVFHPNFVAHHKPVVKSSFLGRVLIERQGEVGEWNPEIGDYVGGGMIPLFAGKARVQKVARPTRRENVFDSADMQTIRVQIMTEDNELVPPAGFAWQDNDRIKVTDADDPMLTGVLAYITGWVGSTNAWQQTFTARYNAKQSPEA